MQLDSYKTLVHTATAVPPPPYVAGQPGPLHVRSQPHSCHGSAAHDYDCSRLTAGPKLVKVLCICRATGNGHHSCPDVALAAVMQLLSPSVVLFSQS